MYILIFFQRSIALWSGEDLIIKVHFISCLKHIRTKKKKKNGNAWEKPSKSQGNT